MQDLLASQFLQHARTKLAEYFGQVNRCALLATTEELWHRANEHTNSIANLLLHLAGNLHQWVAAGLGGAPLRRDRAAEFAQRGPLPAAELLRPLDAVLRECDSVLGGLSAAELARRYTIQEYEVSGLVAVFHVVEHFALHTGQIVHITKTLRNVDLSIYDAAGHKRAGQSEAP
jgi:uncharacterized damage-inducible protein DinB